MSLTPVNPAGLHDPVPFGYSHTVAVPADRELVLVSGQYASRPDGSVAPGDFADQVARTFENLGVALAAHGLGLTDVIQLRTYVVRPDRERLGVLGAAVAAGCGPLPPTQTVLGVAALAMPEILVEVEATAVR